MNSKRLPPARNGCTCICHRRTGVVHFMACCGERSIVQRVGDLRDTDKEQHSMTTESTRDAARARDAFNAGWTACRNYVDNGWTVADLDRQQDIAFDDYPVTKKEGGKVLASDRRIAARTYAAIIAPEPVDIAGFMSGKFDNTDIVKAFVEHRTSEPKSPQHFDRCKDFWPTGDVFQRLGAWLSAALDDPNAGEAFKADVQAWFRAEPRAAHRTKAPTEGRALPIPETGAAASEAVVEHLYGELFVEHEKAKIALARAAVWFRDYERQHRAKLTSEGAMKADTNAERAAYLVMGI